MIRVFSSKAGKEELAQVADSIENQWLGAGPKVKMFEEKFKEKINSKYFLMIDNASNGLFLACKLLNLQKGSEVILPSFTYIACANAIVMAGYKPIFCDVDYETQNINSNFIEPLVTSNTKAIMVVHYAGLPVEMAPILQFNIPIIEDSAHAVNSKYNGKHCGTIGDIGVFSFDSMKNIAVGEGGGISMKSGSYYEMAENYILSGIGRSGVETFRNKKVRWWENEIQDAFIKMRASDITAGFGIAQLNKLSSLQNRREQIWNAYKNELNDINQISMPADSIPLGTIEHSYFTFFLRTPYRDDLAYFLYERGIYTTLRFFPLHMTKYYKNTNRLFNTEKLNETGLNIPLHPNMSDNDLDYVIQSIRDFFKKSSYT